MLKSCLLNFGTRFPLKHQACKGGGRKLAKQSPHTWLPQVPRLGLLLRKRWLASTPPTPSKPQAAEMTHSLPRLPPPTLPSTDIKNSHCKHAFQNHWESREKDTATKSRRVGGQHVGGQCYFSRCLLGYYVASGISSNLLRTHPILKNISEHWGLGRPLAIYMCAHWSREHSHCSLRQMRCPWGIFWHLSLSELTPPSYTAFTLQ